MPARSACLDRPLPCEQANSVAAPGVAAEAAIKAGTILLLGAPVRLINKSEQPGSGMARVRPLTFSSLAICLGWALLMPRNHLALPHFWPGMGDRSSHPTPGPFRLTDQEIRSSKARHPIRFVVATRGSPYSSKRSPKDRMRRRGQPGSKCRLPSHPGSNGELSCLRETARPSRSHRHDGRRYRDHRGTAPVFWMCFGVSPCA